MFMPGCYCCEPPADPCTLIGCTWSATEGTDTEFTGDEAYNSPFGGATPDGTYEVSSFQNPRLGNNLPCRQIWIETVGGAAPTVNENVYAINWLDGATHNPSTQCTLTNVSFCVESKRADDSDPNLTDGVVFVVRQAGKIYATASQSVGKNWKRASGTYTSSDFTWINGSSNPDFTKTGGTIEFGFALRLTVFANTEPFDSVLFDNLCVKLSKECGEACASTGCTVFNTGTALTVTQQSSGTTYGTDPATGLSAPSHKFVLPIATGAKSVTATVADDIFDSTTACASPSGVTVCFNALINPGAGPASVVFRLRQGTTTATIGTASYAGTGTLGWRKTTFSYTMPNPLPFSMATPVVVEVVVSSGTRTDEASVWIDNICITTTGAACGIADPACCSNNMLLTLGTDPFPSPSGACAATKAYVNTVLTGGVVMVRPAVAAGASAWEYRELFSSPSYPGQEGLIWVYMQRNLSDCKFTLFIWIYDNRPAGGSGGFASFVRPAYESGVITDCTAEINNFTVVANGNAFGCMTEMTIDASVLPI